MRSRLQRLTSVLAIVALVLVSRPVPSSGEGWSSPMIISDRDTGANMPDLLSDATGRVHAVWAGKLDADSACTWDSIGYASWDEGTWQDPVDILVSPQGRCATQPALAINPADGYLHIVWSDLYQLYYSSAHADEANSAAGWSEPVAIEGATNALRPDVVAGPDGAIHVAFYRAQPDWEVYYTRSSDRGSTWTPPERIHSAPPDHRIESVELALDDGGRLHLVWIDELVAEGMSRGGAVFYARSIDGGESWEPTLTVDQKDSHYQKDYGAGEIAITTVGEDQVHLVWAGAPAGHRWHQWSADGGETWQDRGLLASVEVFDRQGFRFFNGGQDLAADSLGRVHLVSSSVGLVHAMWDAGRWSDPDLIFPVNPYWPRLAIAQGNEIFAAYMLDVTQTYQASDSPKDMRIWRMEIQTDAPSVAPAPLPTPLPAGRASAKAAAASTVQSALRRILATPAPDQGPPDGQDLMVASGAALALTMVVAAASTIALILVAAGIRAWRQRDRPGRS